MSALLADGDRDVAAAARGAHEAFRRAPLLRGAAAANGAAAAAAAAAGAPATQQQQQQQAQQPAQPLQQQQQRPPGAADGDEAAWEEPELPDERKEEGEADVTFSQVCFSHVQLAPGRALGCLRCRAPAEQ